jgi:hypothetical protein
MYGGPGLNGGINAYDTAFVDDNSTDDSVPDQRRRLRELLGLGKVTPDALLDGAATADTAHGNPAAAAREAWVAAVIQNLNAQIRKAAKVAASAAAAALPGSPEAVTAKVAALPARPYTLRLNFWYNVPLTVNK